MGSGRGGRRPAPSLSPPSTTQPKRQLCRNWETQRWGAPGPARRGENWSFAWLRPFLLVNGFLLCLATTVDKVEATCARWLGPLLACLAACALRDAAVVLFLDVATAGKARLNDRARPSRSQVKDAWRRLFLVAAPVDAITLCLARHLGWVGAPRPTSYLRFVAASFCFEVCFDLGHYWTHRFAHACARRRSGIAKALFNAHAAHHAHASGLAPVLAYAQAPLDVVLCNALPALAALAATGRLLDSVTLVWAYKAYVEAAGHAGCESRATSFPQCVWLPRYLGIALRTADHDAHHGAAAVNFAKRFTLWDRVFGTYATPSPNPPLRAPSFEKSVGG